MIDEVVFHPTGSRAEDILLVRNQGLEVDDDNEPAPENIPAVGDIPLQTNLYPGQTWGWDGIDQRELVIQTKKDASFEGDWMPVGKKWSEIFFKLFPAVWLFDCCMKATSDAIVASGGQALDKGEFVRFIGLWLLMSTCCGWTREHFWDTTPFNARSNPCPFHFTPLMTRHRFNQINSELRFTKEKPPNYCDKFWEVREMVREWNKNMWAFFIPSWVICLNKLTSIWFQRWTCPGWVFCPCKPHPFGNEYHLACCSLSCVMFSIEMVEGKDRPSKLGTQEFDDRGGKTVGLLLRMLQSVFHSGHYVVLNIGFCVLQAIVELKRVGVFAGALIKSVGIGRRLFLGCTSWNTSRIRLLGLLMLSPGSFMASNIIFGA